jgi:acetyl-CoA acetyltransferase
MYGTTFPAYYAFYATAHMQKFGTTEEQMAMVAVKNTNTRVETLRPTSSLR